MNPRTLIGFQMQPQLVGQPLHNGAGNVLAPGIQRQAIDRAQTVRAEEGVPAAGEVRQKQHGAGAPGVHLPLHIFVEVFPVRLAPRVFLGMDEVAVPADDTPRRQVDRKGDIAGGCRIAGKKILQHFRAGICLRHCGNQTLDGSRDVHRLGRILLVQPRAHGGADHVVSARDDGHALAEAQRPCLLLRDGSDRGSGGSGGREHVLAHGDCFEDVPRPRLGSDVKKHRARCGGIAGRSRQAHLADDKVLIGRPAPDLLPDLRLMRADPEHLGKAADVERRHAAAVEKSLPAEFLGKRRDFLAAACVEIDDGAADTVAVFVHGDDDVSDGGHRKCAHRLLRLFVDLPDHIADLFPDTFCVQLQQSLSGEGHGIFPVRLADDVPTFIKNYRLAAGGSHINAHDPHIRRSLL